MNPLLVKYPLDLTGLERRNLVLGEYHDIKKYASLPYRPVVLDYGYFYTEGMVVTDSSGYVLRPEEDYQTTCLNAEAAERSGLEVCGVIVIVNPNVTSEVWVDAQMVGGPYTDVSESIVNLSITLLNDTRSAKWVNIQNRPDVYSPSGHLHPLWDLYGFEPYQDRVDRIHALLLRNSDAEIAEMEADLIAKYNTLKQQRNDELDRLNTHIANKSNPHGLTKTQVGLPQLNNYPIATDVEAGVFGGGAPNRYMTPHGTRLNIATNFTTSLLTHIANKSNPHRVMPEQVGVFPTWVSNQQFNELLGLTETAIGTARLNGVSASSAYNAIRSNLNAVSVVSGRFPVNQIGEGTANAGMALTGDGRWTSLSSMIQAQTSSSTNVLYAGYFGDISNTQAHIKATYANQPIGTIILYHERYYHSRNYSNGGRYVIDYYPMHAMTRTAGGWFGPFSSFNIGS